MEKFGANSVSIKLSHGSARSISIMFNLKGNKCLSAQVHRFLSKLFEIHANTFTCARLLYIFFLANRVNNCKCTSIGY